MHVRDAVPLEDPGALELDVLGAEVVEAPASLAEQHRDEMDLELVEDAGRGRVRGLPTRCRRARRAARDPAAPGRGPAVEGLTRLAASFGIDIIGPPGIPAG